MCDINCRRVNTATGGGQSTSVTIKRPRFQDLWNAYAELGSAGVEEAYNIVGGNVAKLRAENPSGYANGCALRMSRSFNYGGYRIPKGTINPNRNIYRARGGDGLPYIMRVNDVIAFVQHNWGSPEYDISPADLSTINGKQGLMVIVVSGWSDATGHVTLWDGAKAGDNTHYHELNYQYWTTVTARPRRILLWELI